MNLNYSKIKAKKFLLKFLQEYIKIFDGTLGNYTVSDYAIELREDTKP